MRQITCTNTTDNVSMTFDETFAPYLLQDVEGIYTVDANVYSKENTLLDGATINGTVIKSRNIVITIADKENFPEHRNFLHYLFRPKTSGILVYYEKDGSYEEQRSIKYIVEKIEPDTHGNTRQIVISLICADPFFSDLSDTSVEMTSWDSAFEFEHEFSSAGEELGTRETLKMITVRNDSTAGDIGLVITMEAEGTVINPRIYHSESDSYIQLGSTSYPFEMDYGDIVIISTIQNDKNAYLISSGIKTVINEYIYDASEYIQLVNGVNTLTYSAASGEDYLLVKLFYRQKYLGV